MKFLTTSALGALLILAMAETSAAQVTGSTDTQSQQQNQASGDAAKQAQPVPLKGQILTQDHDSLLSSIVIGCKVYTLDNKNIGSISDMILKPDGQLAGYVIGTGGFLGMGKKNVAVPLDMITISQSADFSSVKAVLKAQSADIAAAPEFVSAKTQLAEEALKREQDDMQKQQKQPLPLDPGKANGGSTGTNP